MANPAADYPAALHTTTDVSVFTGSNLGATSPTHTALEGKQEEEIEEVQRKLGIGSTAVAGVNQYLIGSPAGTTTWRVPNSVHFNFGQINMTVSSSGLYFFASGTTPSVVLARLDNNGNMYISGNYLKL